MSLKSLAGSDLMLMRTPLLWPQDIDKAWSEVVKLGPDNAASWSNRGTLRLQHQQWEAAYEDLQHAVTLEQQQTGTASAVVVNNLGNVEGALGRWDDAMRHYQEAAEDPEMGSIAGANYALAAFETGRDELAVKAARTLLRRWVVVELLCRSSQHVACAVAPRNGCARHRCAAVILCIDLHATLCVLGWRQDRQLQMLARGSDPGVSHGEAMTAPRGRTGLLPAECGARCVAVCVQGP